MNLFCAIYPDDTATYAELVRAAVRRGLHRAPVSMTGNLREGDGVRILIVRDTEVRDGQLLTSRSAQIEMLNLSITHKVAYIVIDAKGDAQAYAAFVAVVAASYPEGKFFPTIDAALDAVKVDHPA